MYNSKGRYLFKTKILLLGCLVYIIFGSSIQAQTKMQSGSWSVSPSISNYSLDSNNGERSMTIELSFKDSFELKPRVFLSITQLDADRKTNVRYSVEAFSVSRDGFTLKVKTWGDSKIFSISGCWVAYQE